MNRQKEETMAVANFHYITRMSSGFKVYILEGQPSLRSEDRYRHVTNERVRVPPAHPIKRKHSSDRVLTLEERRERALSRSMTREAQRAAMFCVPPSPTSPCIPSPTEPLPSHVCPAQSMDEPLDLIKKPRKDPERRGEKNQRAASSQIQIRPSVITCVSSGRNPACQSELHCRNTSTVVEQHFQRSLGVDYQRISSRQLSVSVSVDDHFAKALGEKWLQIKSKSSSCSSSTSSPPSSPSVTHSPSYSHSPSQTPKESTTTTTPTFWPAK